MVKKVAKETKGESLKEEKIVNGNQNWVWIQEKTCCIGGSGSLKHSEKIASFDMDDTIIRVKSGAKFAKNADDWIFWH